MISEKVVQLVVNKDDEPKKTCGLNIAIEMHAQIKYCDDEVALVKTTVDIGEKLHQSNHFIVETTKK